MSGSLSILGALPLGGINTAAAASIGLVSPLFIQFDAALFGAFGLGALEADISAQFTAALNLELGLTASISDPFSSIAALGNLLASLSLSLPSISLDVTASLSANIALQAALAVKLGGIQAMISAALAVKLPAVEFFANLSAALAVGPVFLVNFQYGVVDGGLAAAGAAIGAQFGAGLVSGPSSIAPGEAAYGIILLTKSPSVFSSMGAVLKIS